MSANSTLSFVACLGLEYFGSFSQLLVLMGLFLIAEIQQIQWGIGCQQRTDGQVNVDHRAGKTLMPH